MEIQCDQQETRRDRLFQPTEGNLAKSTAQRFSSSIGNQRIRIEYIFHIEILSELRIIGRLYVIWAEIHSQDALMFITICFYWII
jgi:hypothetical protein